MANETETGGLDRRSALKKIGVGAAVAWAAPAVVTALPAFGAPPGSAAPAICQAQTLFACGAVVGVCTPTGSSQECLCDLSTENEIFCGTDSACVDNGCTTSADCPAGSFCVPNSSNCCGSSGFRGGSCAPLCAGGVSPFARVAGGHYQSGR